MPRRRYLTFSLRTVFVLLTIGCVWLAWKCEQARTQREAVKAIEALGGRVRYGWELTRSPGNYAFGLGKAKPPGPAWLSRIVGEEFFQKVHAVSFARVGDWGEFTPQKPTESDILRAIPHLKRLASLKCVTISKYQHRNADIQLKSALPNCEVLYFAIDR